MKRLLYFTFCLLCIALASYSQDYYWYKGSKILLEKGNLQYIVFAKQDSLCMSSNIIETDYISSVKGENIMWGTISKEVLLDSDKIIYKSFSYICPQTSKEMYLTHRFYVRLKCANDYGILQKYANKYNVEIEGEGAMPLWYIMECVHNEHYNALELANIFYESGLFEVSEPEFIQGISFSCVNDTHFASQWNLKNIGQHGQINVGIDINYCEAHPITKGNDSIIIGVFDSGVELTHPDIKLYPLSFNAHTLSSPSIISDAHGTACAGIISAKTNNDMGVAGIAPNCPIMSISMQSSTSPNNVAQGFRFAADSGCSVISCSWIGPYSSYIDSAICYAQHRGRDGKGCIIVFCSGNDDEGNIDYPATSNPDVIVVGAISPNGKRKQKYAWDGSNWGSNWGSELDVMAPGVYIYTTDLSGNSGYDPSSFFSAFRGTSAACPHVAAIAGLILSINSDLTQREVCDIIERTAQKVGGYTYSTHSNRPNGTWNDSVGYGLVDAQAAILYTMDHYLIQGPDFVCMGDTVTFQLRHIPEDAVSLSWEANAGITFMGSLDVVQGQGTPTVRVHLGNNHIGPKGGIVPNFPPINPPFNHNAYVKVMITMADNTIYTVTKNIHGPQGQTPVIEATPSTTPWISGTTRNFTITNNLNTPNEYLEWRIVQRILGNNDSIVIYDYGRTINYTPTIPPLTIGNVTITATNTFETCGEQSASLFFGISNTSLLSAYVDNDQLNVSIHDDDETHQRSHFHLVEEGTCVLELWHNLYGCMQTKQVLNSHEQMNISSLPQGLYVLLLKEEDTVIAQTKIQIP